MPHNQLMCDTGVTMSLQGDDHQESLLGADVMAIVLWRLPRPPKMPTVTSCASANTTITTLDEVECSLFGRVGKFIRVCSKKCE